MDKLYYGGTILTMENGAAEAVLVRDGRIAAVGTFYALRKSVSEVQLIDLAGRTMLPAFLDAHSHFTAVANALLQVPLGEADCFSSITARIQRYIADNDVPSGQWVIASGYDHNQLAEKRHPDIALLDACAPNNPLLLQHRSGHFGVLNSAALQKLGVTAETVSPEGGIIEVRDGKLTGYMEENAFIHYMRQVPMPDGNALMAAYVKAQQIYASHGITTIQEGMMVRELAPLYQALMQNNLLKLDVICYVALADADLLTAMFPDAVKQYDRGCKIAGYKIFLDGSPQGRTAWMKTPYVDAVNGDCGYGTMQMDDVVHAVETASDKEMQLLAHCNGDAAIQQYIDAIKMVARKNSQITRARPVIIHAQLLDYNQMADVKALGLIPSFFIAHVYHWGDIHVQNFGMQRAERISPAASTLKHDIPFTFHQDAPVIEPDMLETIWCAVNRITKSGVRLNQKERISPYEAIRAVTINAAYQYHEEREKGSIALGKRADFVILDGNPLTVMPERIREIRVLETIKDGQTIYLR
ncbi:MAG: amidohydrolase [Clostridia bacterium]